MQNELIPIHPSVVNSRTIDTVNARELHAFLEVGKDFTTWIKDRIESFGFVENQDFVCSPILVSKGRGGHNRTDYHLTLNMGKELSMVERNAKGKEARQYFIACEDKAKAGIPAIVQDPNTRALIQLLTEHDAFKQELASSKKEFSDHRQEFIEVRHDVAAMKPRLTASSINKIQGAISHAAKWYRQSQAVKHIKLSVNESSIYFHMMLLDKFKVADINYIDDIAKAYRFLQAEAKKYQAEYNAWLDRNSLFTGGHA